jgi:hypothetical protein
MSWKIMASESVEPLRQSDAPILNGSAEIAMPVALKREMAAAAHEAKPPVWVHLLIFGMAGLFVSALLMSYGIDLSPGFF